VFSSVNKVKPVDVVEDTEASVAGVQSRFGDLVAACVALLTDAPGANRLANVRACVADGHRVLWDAYQGENSITPSSTAPKRRLTMSRA
jgi:hypothetical protein